MISVFLPVRGAAEVPTGTTINDPLGWTDVVSGGSVYVPVGYNYDTGENIDYMYYIVSLTGGTTYTWTTTSYGGAPVYLYNESLSQVAAASCQEDPETYEYSCSNLTYTPESSGLFILKFGINDYNGMGEPYNASMSPAPNTYSPIQPAAWTNMSGIDSWGYPIVYRDTDSAGLLGFSLASAVFAVNAKEGIKDLISGNTPESLGSGTVLQNDELCFDATRALNYSIGSTMSQLSDFTIEADFTITSSTTGFCGLMGNKTSWGDMCIALQWGRNSYRWSTYWYGVLDSGLTSTQDHQDLIQDGKYHHIAFVRAGSTYTTYLDGAVDCSASNISSSILNLAISGELSVGIQRVENVYFPGRIKHFRISNKAIYTAEFTGNIPSWVGK